MSTETSRISIAAVLTLAVLLAGLMMIPAVSADATDSAEGAEQKYDTNLGQVWSYTYQFIFNGTDAYSITWDFGDGSPTVSASGDSDTTNWNPKHTYAEKGVYYVTQTVENPEGKATYVAKIEIMGFPYVTFVYNNGQPDVTVQQTLYDAPVEKPEDPVKEGTEFTGWYTDRGCKTLYDWDAGVKAPITLYAGWDDGSADESQWLYVTMVGVVLAIASFAAFAYFRVPSILIPAVVFVIVAIVGALLWQGII